ncbi:MAG TPA: L,D-transpeptidase [Pseudorhodoplanes sp.]|nr:L,D-transpeptidase [Pseudorhodoplanes sp.]
MRIVLALAAAAFLLAFQPRDAEASVDVRIDKSAQRMDVIVDGVQAYSWPVSTGLRGGPRSGAYRPQRMERKWLSRKYGMSPMPHAIFFHDGYAIHGTIYVSRLGHPASHGCVRLHPDHAATLFGLVQKHGMGNTRIEVVGNIAARRSSP